MKTLLRRTATVVGATVVGGLVSLGLAAPALAAPGDAEARGLVVDLSAEVEEVPVLALDVVAGSATAPPEGGTDASSQADLDLSGLGGQVTAAVVEVSATRGADESSAEASVTGADLDLFGDQVLAAATATATATCPAVGDQTAETTLTGLEVFGDAVVLDANTPPVVVSAGVTVPGLTDATLEVSLTRIEEVTDDGAAAAAVVADFTLTGTVDGLDVEIPAGTVILAEAACERPAGPPVATDITPDEGPQSGGQTVTITGSGFIPDGTTVTFDGAEATDVVVSDDGTSLTAVTPPGAVGPAEVVVTTVAGSSDPLDYTYLADGSDAVVTGLDPTEGPTTGGTTVTITGSGFTGATGVTFDGIPGTEFTVDADGETITIVTPPHAAGPVPVEIIFPAGTADAGTFTYLAVAPVANDVNPDAGPQSGGQTVTITGSGFVPGATTVTFDGVEATDVVVSDDGTSLTAVTPPGAVGPAEVVVTTEGGSSDPLDYTYLADGSDAVVRDLRPTEGPTTGGTRVTITGSGFTGATGVRFGGIPGTQFTVDADGETITVLTPPHAPGAVPVEIVFPAGTADAGTFTYLAAGPSPVIDSVDPDAGPTTGGTVVTIVGSGFVPGATTVTICAVTIPADQVQVSDDGTVLTFVTPPCPAGPTDVVVTTPAGSSAAASFWYFDPPLPITGTGLWQLLVTGLALVLGGVGLLILVRSGRLRRVLA